MNIEQLGTIFHEGLKCKFSRLVNGLETGGTLWGEASEGDTQGDSAASMRFCVALQASLLILHAACSAGNCGGMVRAGADDITAIGPAHIVFPAVGVGDVQFS